MKKKTYPWLHNLNMSDVSVYVKKFWGAEGAIDSNY